MNLTVNTSVGDIIAAHPAASDVFLRHRIDFCCRGKASLEEECARQGLAPLDVLADVNARIAASPDPARDWTQASTEALIAHILERYHVEGERLMDRINELVEKVVRVHADRFDGVLLRIQVLWRTLEHELRPHFAREEQVFFPAMLRGDLETLAQQPLRVMLADHEGAGQLLDGLVEATQGFEPPAEGCATVRLLYASLQEFDADTRHHIHLENHVLFARLPGQGALSP